MLCGLSKPWADARACTALITGHPGDKKEGPAWGPAAGAHLSHHAEDVLPALRPRICCIEVVQRDVLQGRVDTCVLGLALGCRGSGQGGVGWERVRWLGGYSESVR